MDRFGFDMDLKSSRAPEIDPDTGEITTEAADVLTPVTGLFRFYSQDEINGVDIQANDIQALISGKETSDASLVPDTSMQLIAQGVTYNVVRVTPTQPGGVSVLYRLQIRK
jgi:hypothetical protein